MHGQRDRAIALQAHMPTSHCAAHIAQRSSGQRPSCFLDGVTACADSIVRSAQRHAQLSTNVMFCVLNVEGACGLCAVRQPAAGGFSPFFRLDAMHRDAAASVPAVPYSTIRGVGRVNTTHASAASDQTIWQMLFTLSGAASRTGCAWSPCRFTILRPERSAGAP